MKCKSLYLQCFIILAICHANTLADADLINAKNEKGQILKSMKSQYEELWGDKDSWRGGAYSLKIFISSSMHVDLLRNYAEQARKYNAVLVFKGLPSGSWYSLSEIVNKISKQDAAVEFQIDDEAFDEFDVKIVPTFVLSRDCDIAEDNCTVLFDKLSGNIALRAVLEVFAESGDLKKLASEILQR